MNADLKYRSVDLFFCKEKLDPSSIMLLDNGFELYMHITRAPDPEQLFALFGRRTLDECVHLFRYTYVCLSTETGLAVNNSDFWGAV
jgi:hypothetical protein